MHNERGRCGLSRFTDGPMLGWFMLLKPRGPLYPLRLSVLVPNVNRRTSPRESTVYGVRDAQQSAGTSRCLDTRIVGDPQVKFSAKALLALLSTVTVLVGAKVLPWYADCTVKPLRFRTAGLP